MRSHHHEACAEVSGRRRAVGVVRERIGVRAGSVATVHRRAGVLGDSARHDPGPAHAADTAAPYGIEIMVEAVNTFENGPYLLHTTQQAVDFVESVSRENVKVQHDFYHMQRRESAGN